MSCKDFGGLDPVAGICVGSFIPIHRYSTCCCMLDKIFTAMLNLIRSIMRAFNLETEIVLTEHKIKTKAVKPERSEKAWDDSHWVHGNIFIKDYANPVKISKEKIEENDYHLIASERYKTFMEQDLIDDMLQASKDSGLTLLQALIVILSTNLLSVGMIYAFTTGMI